MLYVTVQFNLTHNREQLRMIFRIPGESDWRFTLVIIKD